MIPVLDDDKHYWIGEDEVQKLLRHGEGWLVAHPQREQIVGRYLKHRRHLAREALARLLEEDQKRFGVRGEETGIIYTRTGRRFFDDRAVEAALLAKVHDAISRASYWEQFTSDWFCLDCELMPWSAKAQDLLKNQYAAVGAAAGASLADAMDVLQHALPRYGGGEAETLSAILDAFSHRRLRAEKYVKAYRHYCWPVNSIEDLKLAPFHLLASEGAVHVDRDHLWHMQNLAKLADAGFPLMATNHVLVDLGDQTSTQAAIAWWQDLTSRGGEGMVIKPLEFAVRGKKGLVQPAVKCRGSEYLRIIYGPQYDEPANLQRLRSRGLAAKRSLALREFALGIEGLERFVRREPLRRVHECVFGVLALESEPVDPRL